MALIVETGSGVTGANSYRSLIDAQAFLDVRALSATLTEAHLLRAMDTLWEVNWIGVKTDQDNALPWPRSAPDMRIRDVLISSTQVPVAIGDAQTWIAYYIQSGVDLLARTELAVRSETVGPISTVYASRMGEKDTVTLFSLPQVRRALTGYWIVAGAIDRA